MYFEEKLKKEGELLIKMIEKQTVGWIDWSNNHN
jgi:hypothetical protein